MEIVSFNNVNKMFGDFKALDDLSFSCHSNKVLGIVGNNGSGKTTIVNIVCNLIRYTSGVVKCFDEVLTKNSTDFRNRLGIVLTDHPLVDDFKPHEYLKFVGNFQNMDQNELKDRIDRSIVSFNIPNKRIGRLSSGNRINVAIAASLLHNPDLLIYDEPFNFLDISSINSLKEILLLVKKKKTMIITSHNIDALCDICDEILIIDKGKLLKLVTIPNDIGTFKLELLDFFGASKNPVDISWIE